MLGKKLKEVRRKRGYSLDELSRKAGFSKSFLSQIENGKNSPSIASLKKITDALDISIGGLFEEDTGDQVYFLKKEDRKPFEVVKDKVLFEFGSSMVPNRRMEVLFFTLAPGGASEGEYSHEGEEFGTVLEGKLLFQLGDKEYLLEPGDSVYFNSTTPHCWRNAGDETLRGLWVISPPSF